MTTNSKKLRKSKENSLLFGGAGGMAEFFDVDPTLMRAAWIVFVLISGGTGLIAYIILAIIMPKQGFVSRQTSQSVYENAEEQPEDVEELVPHDGSWRWTARRALFGIALVVVGFLFLLSNLGVFAWWRWDVFWPLGIIAIGAALILGRFTGGSDD